MSDDILGALRRRAPRVTVVGDVILDRWVRGGVRRVSREAPVPVVDARTVEASPGGAANTAVNLVALGARVSLLSAVGRDAEGTELLRLLTGHGVDVSGVVAAEGAVTATKTRIVGEDQILVRVDRASIGLVLPAIGVDADALLVCDYGGGLFDDAVVNRLSGMPERAPLVVVDAHDLRRWAPLRADVVTPNAGETELLLGAGLGGDRAEAVAAAASRVLGAAGSRAAVVTLDVQGTVVLEGGRVTGRTRAVPAAEQQASGAGDTFAAALTVALCSGAGLPAAAAFAQRAADVVVARPGTAVCTTADLASEGGGLLTHDELARRIDEERARGRRIVFANGCFDLIHRGHTTHLHQARDQGDVLVVALNDDESVRRLKGPGRPVNPLPERAAVLQELGCVDYVTAFAEDSPVALIERLRPEVYTKGGDYTPEMVPEAQAVRSYGGEVQILDYLPHRSTTETVARIRAGRRNG
ncbi:D-glycero-beta-D-manno-heptose 1-phosphate adenylyltransferase [Microbacterium trichothecenolyticum]|uniref:D-glycero-beta-D-manno-heptose 1-phosphate adenylyltransferase n=1 Tax=Microbacterium trichothecenolyticum TaxID=69370 RepID=A0ABU0TSH6_MICTR|nr:D-glycero-beta-D-manno-heptose 1-phosphate adenylyltransferase [Microbacterium trichothecenolyticum]MDQ1122617.1 D-beta-D-heptose 7-phosphate kinase/D-beta-D-heptose 1-phosphate adenosyltransferase [Microbacterium trichothecenolyticum]